MDWALQYWFDGCRNLRIDKAINFFGFPSLESGGRKLVRTPHALTLHQISQRDPFSFQPETHQIGWVSILLVT
jgi:hypothetical protein